MITLFPILMTLIATLLIGIVLPINLKSYQPASVLILTDHLSFLGELVSLRDSLRVY